MKTCVLFSLLLLGCSSPTSAPPSSSAEGERSPNVEAVASDAEGAPSEAGVVDTPEPSSDAENEPRKEAPMEAETSGLADGAACTANAQCASGTCEGEGCGDDSPGTCMPLERMCLRDLRPFCGCDGKTFMRGSNCPGQRFAARGPCAGDPPSPQLPPRQ